MSIAAALLHLPTLLAAGNDPLGHVLPHTLFEVGGYSFTNHIAMLILSAVLLLLILPVAARAQGIVPTGLRNLVETVCQYIREDMARPALGKYTDRFMPFIWTLFFLILTANLLGMIPLGAFLGRIDSHLAHMQGTATGNLMVTAGLAICAFFFIHISGLKAKGPRYFGFLLGHAPVALAPLMVPLEIVAALVKPFALAVRLFANMVAGHVVLAVILGFGAVGLAKGRAMLGITGASVLGATFISLLELLVAFLQAYIFTYLTILFVGMAVEDDH
jgi:F-type H+-transporting ATPase subunit a